MVDTADLIDGTAFAGMIALELSISSCVFDMAGDGFSVQLMYKALRSLSSQPRGRDATIAQLDT